MKQEVASFLDYVAHFPTVFQATQQACDMLDAAGFTRLSEHEAWEILPGGRYYVTRNRSALVAFAVAAGAYIRLDVEPYGGMIMSTWFDRQALHRRARAGAGGRQAGHPADRP